jgi:hypothetical protein
MKLISTGRRSPSGANKTYASRNFSYFIKPAKAEEFVLDQRRSSVSERELYMIYGEEGIIPDARNLSREFFDATVENCRKVIDAVKPRRAKFTIEMMGWSLPDSADACVRLFRAIARHGFGVHVVSHFLAYTGLPFGLRFWS